MYATWYTYWKLGFIQSITKSYYTKSGTVELVLVKYQEVSLSDHCSRYWHIVSMIIFLRNVWAGRWVLPIE